MTEPPGLAASHRAPPTPTGKRTDHPKRTGAGRSRWPPNPTERNTRIPPATTQPARDRAEHRHQASLLADRAWLALAALAQTAPDNIVAEQLLAAAPSVQQLSLRNQITLLLQAAEQRIVLRDVDTEQGWLRRGRVPNQPGLRIVRPHDGPSRGDGPGAGRRRFRVSHRWEFTQTKPADHGVAAQTTPRAAGDPAEFAVHLINQLGGHGYRITPGSATDVHHQARLITIAEPTWHGGPAGAVRVLIPTLAQALVATSDGRLYTADRRTG